ncbi:unnamed protein product [Paramecium primaurelia]|uniref:Uncharacterized protein n=1 Tax=Paramecium primaurelia TaxID=5886 RepID=A0A8S1LQM2_PARPR|nr:unnamed protein product [Paramecium primaurelia]
MQMIQEKKFQEFNSKLIELYSLNQNRYSLLQGNIYKTYKFLKNY